MRDRGRGGDGGRDWGSIDWSNIDLSTFGRGAGVRGPSRRAVGLTLVLVLLLLFPLLFSPLVAFLTDLLWFRSLGLEDVYLRRYTAAFWAFVAFFLLFFFFGLAGGDQWDVLLRWVNGVPFGSADPVFGRDIGFYFFTLPVLEFLRGWLLAAIVVIAAGI